MKKYISIFLCLVMIISSCQAVFADEQIAEDNKTVSYEETLDETTAEETVDEASAAEAAVSTDADGQLPESESNQTPESDPNQAPESEAAPEPDPESASTQAPESEPESASTQAPESELAQTPDHAEVPQEALMDPAGNIAAQGSLGDTISWTLDSEGVLTITGTGAIDDSVSPDYGKYYFDNVSSEHSIPIRKVIIGEGITNTGRNLFRECKDISSVVLPDTIEVISDFSFYNCKNLKSIELPPALKEIRPHAFHLSGLESVEIPYGVALGPHAFDACSNLTSAILPESLTVFPLQLFFACHKLKELRLPSNVKSIPANAFIGTGVEKLEIPESLGYIGMSCFPNSCGLKSVFYTGTEESWKGINIQSGNTKLDAAAVHFNSTLDVHSPGEPAVQIEAAETAGHGSINTVVCCTVCGEEISRESQDFSFSIPESLTIEKGQTSELPAIETDLDLTKDEFAPTWQSSDPSVISIDAEAGTMTALKAGSADITLSICNIPVKCTVTSAIYPTAVLINEETVSLVECQTIQGPAVTISPDGAAGTVITWKSSDESIVTVDENGNLTGVSQGQARITASVVGKNGEELSDSFLCVVNEATCRISFDGNGNTAGVMAPVVIACSKESVLPENEFTKEGFAFDSWNTSADGQGISYPDKGAVTIAKEDRIYELKLYAIWKPAVYTIRYELDGGTNNPDNPETFKVTDAAKNLKDPAKKGYNFGGWYTDPEFNNRIYSIPPQRAGDIVIFAKWTARAYTIVFNANDGTGYMADMVCEYDKEYVLTKNSFNNSPLVFAGWNTDSSGRGAAYQDGQRIKNLAVSGTVYLYAQWETGKYTVRFDGNGATSGAMEDISLEFGEDEFVPGSAYTRKGYQFTEWNTQRDGSGDAYAEEDTIRNMTDVNGETVVLYAQWKAIVYKITYYLNGGTNNKKNPATFKISNNKITLSAPARTGYTFAGWYTDQALTKKTTGIAANSIGNRKVYAKWTPNRYTIKFSANGAKSGTMSARTIKYGVSYTLPANAFKKTNYTFAGWNTKKDGSGMAYKNKASVKNLTSKNGGSIILYAQWKINQYSIVFDINDKSGKTAKMTLQYGKSYKLKANTFKRTNLVFLEWNTKANGSGKAYKNKATVKNLSSKNGAVIKLYAIWKPQQSKVKVSKFCYNQNNVEVPELKNVTGYEFYRSTSANGKYTKISKQTFNECEDYDATSGRKYYYKARAYIEYSSKRTVYGAFSKPVAITTALEPQIAGWFEPRYGKYTYISNLYIENWGTKTLTVGSDEMFFNSVTVIPYRDAYSSRTTLDATTVSAGYARSIKLITDEKRVYGDGAHVIFCFKYDGCWYMGIMYDNGHFYLVE